MGLISPITLIVTTLLVYSLEYQPILDVNEFGCTSSDGKMIKSLKVSMIEIQDSGVTKAQYWLGGANQAPSIRDPCGSVANKEYELQIFMPKGIGQSGRFNFKNFETITFEGNNVPSSLLNFYVLNDIYGTEGAAGSTTDWYTKTNTVQIRKANSEGGFFINFCKSLSVIDSTFKGNNGQFNLNNGISTKHVTDSVEISGTTFNVSTGFFSVKSFTLEKVTFEDKPILFMPPHVTSSTTSVGLTNEYYALSAKEIVTKTKLEFYVVESGGEGGGIPTVSSVKGAKSTPATVIIHHKASSVSVSSIENCSMTIIDEHQEIAEGLTTSYSIQSEENHLSTIHIIDQAVPKSNINISILGKGGYEGIRYSKKEHQDLTYDFTIYATVENVKLTELSINEGGTGYSQEQSVDLRTQNCELTNVKVIADSLWATMLKTSSRGSIYFSSYNVSSLKVEECDLTGFDATSNEALMSAIVSSTTFESSVNIHSSMVSNMKFTNVIFMGGEGEIFSANGNIILEGFKQLSGEYSFVTDTGDISVSQAKHSLSNNMVEISTQYGKVSTDRQGDKDMFDLDEATQRHARFLMKTSSSAFLVASPGAQQSTMNVYTSTTFSSAYGNVSWKYSHNIFGELKEFQENSALAFNKFDHVSIVSRHLGVEMGTTLGFKYDKMLNDKVYVYILNDDMLEQPSTLGNISVDGSSFTCNNTARSPFKECRAFVVLPTYEPNTVDFSKAVSLVIDSDVVAGIDLFGTRIRVFTVVNVASLYVNNIIADEMTITTKGDTTTFSDSVKNQASVVMKGVTVVKSFKYAGDDGAKLSLIFNTNVLLQKCFSGLKLELAEDSTLDYFNHIDSTVSTWTKDYCRSFSGDIENIFCSGIGKHEINTSLPSACTDTAAVNDISINVGTGGSAVITLTMLSVLTVPVLSKQDIIFFESHLPNGNKYIEGEGKYNSLYLYDIKGDKPIIQVMNDMDSDGGMYKVFSRHGLGETNTSNTHVFNLVTQSQIFIGLPDATGVTVSTSSHEFNFMICSERHLDGVNTAGNIISNKLNANNIFAGHALIYNLLAGNLVSGSFYAEVDTENGYAANVAFTGQSPLLIKENGMLDDITVETIYMKEWVECDEEGSADVVCRQNYVKCDTNKEFCPYYYKAWKSDLKKFWVGKAASETNHAILTDTKIDASPQDKCILFVRGTTANINPSNIQPVTKPQTTPGWAIGLIVLLALLVIISIILLLLFMKKLGFKNTLTSCFKSKSSSNGVELATKQNVLN